MTLSLMTVTNKRALYAPPCRAIVFVSRWEIIKMISKRRGAKNTSRQILFCRERRNKSGERADVILNLIAHRIHSSTVRCEMKTIRLIYLHIF